MKSIKSSVKTKKRQNLGSSSFSILLFAIYYPCWSFHFIQIVLCFAAQFHVWQIIRIDLRNRTFFFLHLKLITWIMDCTIYNISNISKNTFLVHLTLGQSQKKKKVLSCWLLLLFKRFHYMKLMACVNAVTFSNISFNTCIRNMNSLEGNSEKYTISDKSYFHGDTIANETHRRLEISTHILHICQQLITISMALGG